MAKRQTGATRAKPTQAQKNKAAQQSKAGKGVSGSRPQGKGKARDATSINPKKETPITPESPALHPA